MILFENWRISCILRLIALTSLNRSIDLLTLLSEKALTRLTPAKTEAIVILADQTIVRTAILWHSVLSSSLFLLAHHSLTIVGRIDLLLFCAHLHLFSFVLGFSLSSSRLSLLLCL